MQHFEELWAFKTARFTVTLEAAPEDDPDLSCDDEETIEKVKQGIYSVVVFRVRVLLDGREIGADYLGNSVYERVSDFAKEHRTGTDRNTLALKAQGVSICAYFPSMVRQAIAEARRALCAAPRVRCA